MAISFLAYLATFLDSIIFRKATCSHFFRVNFFKVTQQWLFRCSSFFRVLLKTYFFRTATFSHLFFQNSYFFKEELLPGSHFLWMRNSLVQLLFRTATYRRDLQRSYFFQSKLYCTVSMFSEKPDFGKSYFFRKGIFRITYFFYLSFS